MTATPPGTSSTAYQDGEAFGTADAWGILAGAPDAPATHSTVFQIASSRREFLAGYKTGFIQVMSDFIPAAELSDLFDRFAAEHLPGWSGQP
jgi:hypothetical protein